MAGKFITLEGGEGAGKSTQAPRLAAHLERAGHTVCITREPGGAPGAEAIRELLVTGDPGRWDAAAETLLHYAARRSHLTDTIRPALARGEWVVCDRFADSTLAYQGYVGGVDKGLISEIHARVVGDLTPDLTLILDLPPETGLARAQARSQVRSQARGEAEDRYERMGLKFHRRLRAAFLEIAANEPERCMVVDAEGDMETVAARIKSAVEDRLEI